MRQRIRKALTYNLGFKILALALAFILWLVVYNIEDPDKTNYYTIAVDDINGDSLKEQNKWYEIVNNSDTITFAVTAKRSILDKLSESDFKATADMDDMTVSDDGSSGSVPISITCIRYSSQLKIDGRARYLEVSLEDMLTKQFMISAQTTGEVADGYALGTVTVENPNVLKVSGPKSAVEQIEEVIATIDVDGMSQDISDNVIPELYDESGNEVDTTGLELSNTTVTIQAKILSIKEVPLKFSTSGKPAGDNEVIGIESSTETVQIKGTNAVLNQISSITVPEEVLDVTGAEENLETDINITEYLPEGAELVDQSQATVHVTVEIQVYKEKKVSISTSDLKIVGLDAGDTLSYSLSAVVITVQATAENLALLNTTTLRGSIDVDGLAEGTHSVPITLNLDSSRYRCQNYYVEIKISGKTSE